VGEDPERLEREIERTRARLGEDLDALEEKINPKKVAHRSVDRAKEKAAEVKDKVVGAAGAAKEKVTGGSSGSERAGPTGVTAADVDQGAGVTAPNGQSGGIGDRVAGLAGAAREKVVPLAVTAKDKAAVRAGLDPQTADTREVATAVAGGAWETLREQTRRNPVAVGAAAFVLGVLIGR
jgi:hypothetical protein